MAKNKRSDKVVRDQFLSISRLHLDPLNPRHDPLTSDAEVISQLCSQELIAELAKDIAERGTLNPLDVLGVIPYDDNPGHYIAVEGNRRVCALILLNDPSRAPNSKMQAQIRSIASSAVIPKQVKVHIFADRDEAKPWIDLRHLGQQNGVGIREWNSSQKTRAAGNNIKTSSQANKLSLLVLDRLVQIGLLDSVDQSKVNLTTITRYLGTPGVRAILGLASSSELLYSFDSQEVDNALQKLVLDSIHAQPDGTFSVNSRSNSSERLAYATNLKSQGIAPSTVLPVAASPSAPFSNTNTPQAKSKSARSPSTIPTLFDRSFTVKCKDTVLLHLRDEILKLPLKEYPFSGNYLLRAFIERVMILFAKHRGKYANSLNDQKLTELCGQELKELGVSGTALTIVNKAASSSAQPYSLHSLGNAVHGGAIPSAQHLKAQFETWKPSLVAMLNQL